MTSSNDDDQGERQRAITYLLNLRDDPKLRAAALNLPNRMTGEQARTRDRASQLGAALIRYGAELEGLSDEEIFAREREARERQENLRLVRELQFHFNQAGALADISYWSVFPDWSIEEGIALVLDRDPRAVTFEVIKAYVSVSRVAKLFADLMALAERTRLAGLLRVRNPPGEFLRWVERTKLVTIPPRLLSALDERGVQVIDWQDVANRQGETLATFKANISQLTDLVTSQREALQTLAAERDSLLTEIAEMRETLARSPKEDDAVDSSERPSYLKLIGALVQLMKDKDELTGRALFPSQNKLKDAILAKHPGKFGLGDRSIQEMLARANEAIAKED